MGQVYPGQSQTGGPNGGDMTQVYQENRGIIHRSGKGYGASHPYVERKPFALGPDGGKSEIVSSSKRKKVKISKAFRNKNEDI